MSDKLPMTREQISYEGLSFFPSDKDLDSATIFAEHILRIGTTELREENKRLRSWEFICKKCGLRTDADNVFKEVPF